MTGTIQGPIYLHLARKNDFPGATLVYEDELQVHYIDSLGYLQSAAWPELAPAATNLYERNSELLPSRYFEACHHRRKGLMLRLYSLLFTCPGRCACSLNCKQENAIFINMLKKMSTSHVFWLHS